MHNTTDQARQVRCLRVWSPPTGGERAGELLPAGAGAGAGHALPWLASYQWYHSSRQSDRATPSLCVRVRVCVCVCVCLENRLHVTTLSTIK